MIASINNYWVNLAQPIDISILLTNTDSNPIAWYLEKPVIAPVVIKNWVAEVSAGNSSVNFNNIAFNPHAHGTHTECLGHITHQFYSINDCLRQFFFEAELISLTPEKQENDTVITKNQIQKALKEKKPEALIIRTLPNNSSKCSQKYSHTNPTYITSDAAAYLCSLNIQHLLVDLPSIDKEKDAGQLLAHKAFWNVKNTITLNTDARLQSTITEMIFVPNTIPDGSYLLNLQIASFANDASPSKPILYKIENAI